MTKLSAYRSYWHPLAYVEDVTEKPQQFTLLGEKLVAFRNDKGIHVLKDLCIHRGMELSRGRIVNGNIECPYHGWQYNGEGSCVRIPSLTPDKPIPSKARAIRYQVKQAFGLVFVALEPPKLDTIAIASDWAYENPDLRFCRVGDYLWPVDAGRVMENALDTSHFAFVHDGTLGDREHPLVPEYAVRFDDHSIAFDYRQVEPGEPSAAHADCVHLRYFYHAPFTLALKREVDGGKFTALYSFMSPVDETHTRLFMLMGRNFDTDPEHDHVYTRFVDKANREDESMIDGVHPEQIPTDLSEELHIKIPDAAGIVLRRILGRMEGETPARIVA